MKNVLEFPSYSGEIKYLDFCLESNYKSIKRMIKFTTGERSIPDHFSKKLENAIKELGSPNRFMNTVNNLLGQNKKIIKRKQFLNKFVKEYRDEG